MTRDHDFEPTNAVTQSGASEIGIIEPVGAVGAHHFNVPTMRIAHRTAVEHHRTGAARIARELGYVDITPPWGVRIGGRRLVALIASMQPNYRE